MKGTLLSALVSGIRSLKDGSVSISFETMELPPLKAAEIFSMRNKVASIYINAMDIGQDEIDKVDKLTPDLPGKTQSQRIRNTLFVLWQQNNEGHKDFETFYKSKTEIFIETLKSNIE